MKKAQLTMFMILGLVILAIFGFVFFASSQIQLQRTSGQAEKIAQEILETGSLKTYTSLCAERALDSGLDLISKQGGRIFPGQVGSLLKNPEKSYVYKDLVNDKTYNVAYGIAKDQTPLPQYPCKVGFDNYNSFPAFCEYKSLDLLGKSNSKFINLEFGIANLPKLCKDRLSGCSLREGWDTRFSVQSQLESYISQYVKNCVDFAAITGINETYNVTEGDVSTNLTFSDTDISAEVHFPIIIQPLIGQPIEKFVDFETSMPTRFKIIYGLARDSVTNDVSSPNAPTFNLFNGLKDIISRRFKNQDSGLDTEYIENLQNFDNFIKITDKTSEKELILQFLEENRPPVIEYINPFGQAKTICGDYDIIAIEGSTLTLQPKSFDTEEDAITYEYSGWLYNYNETIVAPVADEKGCVLSYSTLQIALQKPRWIFTGSQEQKNLELSAVLTPTDVGPHNFTIKVCDSQYCDFQLIRFLIEDLLKIEIIKSNPYNSETFSIEDPYKLTAEAKKIYNPGVYSFFWKIEDQNELICSDESLPKCLDDPTKKELNFPFGDYNILNIKEKYTNTFPNLKEGSIYTITGKVDQGGQNSAVEPIEGLKLQKCAVYENEDSSAFPYNATDPFLSDHSCCIEGANGPELKSGDCFTPESTYGSYLSFDAGKYNTSYDEGNVKLGNPATTSNKNTIIQANSNDVYKRTFIRKCDGTRGNICIGNIFDTYSVASQCPNKPTNDVATCSGPNRNLLKKNSESPLTYYSQCENYGDANSVTRPATTMEKELGLRNNILCSQKSLCVSNPNAPDGYLVISASNAHYNCNATCGTTGCSRTIYSASQSAQSLCVDCYAKQTCSAVSVSQNEAPKINVNDYDVCENLADHARCKLTEKPLSNTCANNVLTNYICKIPPFTTPDPYETKTQDCIKERQAEITTNGCIYYQLGTCSNGRCSNDNKITLTDGGKFKDDSTCEYKFRQYSTESALGTNININEKCKETIIDYDTSQSLCTSLKYVENGVQMSATWDGTKCIGNDMSERSTC